MKQRLKQHKVNNSKNKRAVTLRPFFTLHHPHALLCNIPQFQTETPASACVCSNDCPPFADVSNLQIIFGVKLYELSRPAKPLKIFRFPKVHGVVRSMFISMRVQKSMIR